MQEKRMLEELSQEMRRVLDQNSKLELRAVSKHDAMHTDW
jgi:hypothetical protein